MQGDSAIRRIQGLPATTSFGIHCSFGDDERGNVCDRVSNGVARCGALQLERLIQIARALRVQSRE